MDIMRVHSIRNTFMDLIRDGKYPDSKSKEEIELGGDAGMNLHEGIADFTIRDKVSNQRFEIYIKPLPKEVG